MRRVVFAFLLALAGCASPSPQFMGGERHDVAVGGSTFTIWRSGDAVEVYRTSPEMLPSLSATMAKAEQAIAQATGCQVKAGTLTGDAALMKAELDCT